MKIKNSFHRYLLAGFVLTHVFGADVFAGWHCSDGQPDSCINELKNQNAYHQKEINELNSKMVNGESTISNCWKSLAQLSSSDIAKAARKCSEIENQFRNVFPAMIQEKESAIRYNSTLLNNDHCRNKHCYYTNSGEHRL